MKPFWKTTVILLVWALVSCTGNDQKKSEPLGTSIIFPLQKEHVHGPTIVELPQGDLLAAWFQGSGERWADDVRIMGSRLPAGDTSWTAPFLMADMPGFPDINPMMFLDNQQRLWLMWYVVLANQWETSQVIYRISSDYGGSGAPEWDWQDLLLVKPGDKTERGILPGDRFVQGVRKQLEDYEAYFRDELLSGYDSVTASELLTYWEKYKLKLDSLSTGQNMLRGGKITLDVVEKDTVLGYPLTRRIGWQTKNKALVLEDRIIVPLYSDGLDCSIFAITRDSGKTWEFSNPVLGGAGIQAAMGKGENLLAAYFRDNGPPPQRMQKSVSPDQGLNWSIPKDDHLPNPGAGFDLVTLSNGNWLMIYNDTEDGRHSLALSLSEDEGKTWKYTRHLEQDNRGKQATSSHYPALIEGKDGRIHAVYSFHHNDRSGQPHKTIKYAAFDLDWIKNGTN